jgi:hypothetical protein
MLRADTSSALLLDQPAQEAIVLQRLESMMSDDEYDESFLPPSVEAHDFARAVLLSAAARLKGGLPRATPAPVGDGGLFIQFGAPSRYVRMLVPSQPGGAYLVVARDGKMESLAGFNGNDLAERLQDLSARPGFFGSTNSRTP